MKLTILFEGRFYLTFFQVLSANKFANPDAENVNPAIKATFDAKFVSCDIYMVTIGSIEYKAS